MRTQRFGKDVKPILTEFCFDCHADGAKKGNVDFDKFKTDGELLNDRTFWFKVLKYVRADVMPPSKKPHPDPGQKQAILDWIKRDVFELDPNHPNPGRVTVHRLNRAEYRNTVRDLMGVDSTPTLTGRPTDASLDPILARPYRGDWIHPGGHGVWQPRDTQKPASKT